MLYVVSYACDTSVGWKDSKSEIQKKWGTLQVFYGKDLMYAGNRQFTGFPPANRQFLVCAIIAQTLKRFMMGDSDEIKEWHCPREGGRLFEALREVSSFACATHAICRDALRPQVWDPKSGGTCPEVRNGV